MQVGVAGPDDGLLTIDDHLTAIRLLQRIVDIGRDEIDDVEFDSIARSDVDRVTYGIFSPIGITAAQFGEFAHPRYGVVDDLAVERRLFAAIFTA